MNKLIGWIKENKLAALLLVLIAWLVYKVYFLSYFPVRQKTTPFLETPQFYKTAEKAVGRIGIPPIPGRDIAPAPEVEDRLVVQESNISLLVTDVRKTADEVVDYVQGQGGYMVDTSLSHPEEAAYGTVKVRIPTEKLQEALSFFRSLAIRVTSERLIGTDVTDEYVDIEARLATLNKTKAKFEEILAKAAKVEDILRVQREIINLQEQIDRLKGRQKYLEQTAKMAKITLHLSTDELALPYAPSEAWRPKVVFKMAVRSLVRALRKAGSALIWFTVYAVVWVPVLAIYLLVKRYRKRSS